MKKRISGISVHQTSWTVALWSFLVAFVLWIFWSIYHLVMAQYDMIFWGLGGIVVYGIVTYVYWIVASLIYNWAACWTGGIEFTVKEGKPCAPEQCKES